MNTGKIRYIGSLVLGVLGSFGAALQAGLLMTRGEAICLSEGCRIIEGLTRVPPQFINLAGAVFFLGTAILIWRGSRSKFAQDLAELFLLAGIAVEGVLFSYQYFVAKTFCPWCIGVMAIVVLLNLLAGLRQSLRATAIFTSSVVAFAVLSFGVMPHPDGKRSLDRGTWGIRRGTEPAKQHYLIFSWNCPHCAEVLRTLERCNRLSFYLNPIDKGDGQKVAGVELMDFPEPEVNRQLMSLLGINEVPVLLVIGPEGVSMVGGGKQIDEYIRVECNQDKPVFNAFSLQPLNKGGLSLPVLHQTNKDGCNVTEACPPVSELFTGKR
ncbi:MAG: vitamin K epoxide reductase family protein [Desulfobulbaceae bacterium]|nr:vitamin K epoxide reductase family protein [Desulfobulbaceae bacterium]